MWKVTINSKTIVITDDWLKVVEGIPNIKKFKVKRI